MDRDLARHLFSQGEMPLAGAGADFASAEALIAEARAERICILTDDTTGYLVVPASAATPDNLNFMARHGRGLICLAITQARADQIGLAPMPRRSGGAQRGRFTVSIEAREGVTTGISCADRARTIEAAIAPSARPHDIVSPGHVFPQVAHEGGVLGRAEPAEAAVDLARLAGSEPAGVFCGIMNDDGSMAGLAELVELAQTHGLRLGTVGALCAWRQRHDGVVKRVEERVFHSLYGGQWRARTYVNALDGAHHVALIKGAPAPGRPTPVRLHALSLMDDCLGALDGRGALLNGAMAEIGQAGAGVVVIVGGAAGPLHRPSARGGPAPTPPAVLEEYGVAAQILVDLGLSEIVLLTGSDRHQLVGLEGYGLKVLEARQVQASQPAGAR